MLVTHYKEQEMANLNSDNIIKSIGGKDKGIEVHKKTKNSSKSNKQVYILIGLILFCIVGGYLVFGSGTKEAESLPRQAEVEKYANKEVMSPPPLADKKVENETPTAVEVPAKKEVGLEKEQINDLFNQSAINDALNAPVPAPAPRPQEPKYEVQEAQKGGRWVSAPEIGSQSKMDAVVAAARRSEQQKEETKSKLSILQDNVIVKVNYFTYGGKNYYEGDKILNYKVKEVTKNKVTLQDENKKNTTLNFGSKR